LDDTRCYPDELPFTLHFEFSREQTRKLLGFPVKSGGGDFSFLYGTVPLWDKYFYKDFSLHIQFYENLESVELITIDSLV